MTQQLHLETRVGSSHGRRMLYAPHGHWPVQPKALRMAVASCSTVSASCRNMIFAWVSLIWQRVQGFSRRGAVEHSWEVVTSPLIRAAQYVAAVLKTFDDGACGNARSRQLAGKDRHKKTAVKHKKKRNKRKKKKAKKNAGRGQSSQSGDVSARPDDGLREGCVQKVSTALSSVFQFLLRPFTASFTRSCAPRRWQS